MNQQVLTANRLRDGAVVYLGPDDQWCERIGDGRVAADEAEGKAWLAIAARAVAASTVVDPYLIDVALRDGILRPLRYRERIRAGGPTSRADLGRRTAEG